MQETGSDCWWVEVPVWVDENAKDLDGTRAVQLYELSLKALSCIF